MAEPSASDILMLFYYVVSGGVGFSAAYVAGFRSFGYLLVATWAAMTTAFALSIRYADPEVHHD